MLTIAWLIGGGWPGWGYLIAYGLACAPGLPLGFRLFGRSHAAGWVAGAVLGYGITAFAWGLAIQLGLTAPLAFGLLWLSLCAGLLYGCRAADPLVALPRWTPRDTRALLAVLLLVPAIVGPPFLRLGERDAAHRRRYRAYFTADYLWHVALTSELARLEPQPRNPYLASEPLHYYWTYFNVPAVLAAMRATPAAVESHVKVNALGAGLLFVAGIFLAAWAAVPRARAVGSAVLLTVAGASAEGAYAIWDLWSRGAPLDGLRSLNIDAITSWFLRSLTIDGLPRSLWYTPQHAYACVSALLAVIVASAADLRRPAAAALIAGVGLGLSLVCSPFLGGVFAVIYGLTAALRAAHSAQPLRQLLWASMAAIPVLGALGWCLASGTFEGAGGAVAVGFSRRASIAPYRTLALALGPVLLAALAGLAVAWRRGYRWQGAWLSLAAGLGLFYFVTLTKEPVWVGWRAGQVILVTIPALAAACFASLSDRPRGRIAAAGLLVALLAIGLPTTLIDIHNAADVEHDAMGPGFRWTVVLPHDTEAATRWIRERTPPGAIVQMSIAPRGRETWTLIPTFAQRRMAAGQPISLLAAPVYDTASDQADAMYRAADPQEAARLAHALRIDYIYIDGVERQAFSADALDKFHDRRFFTPVFWKGSAEVIKVQ